MKIKYVLLSIASIARSFTLNILGPGTLWGFKSVIESHFDKLDLSPTFRPIYYTAVGLLATWQVYEWTTWSFDQFDEEIKSAQEDKHYSKIARDYPILYLFRARPEHVEEHELVEDAVPAVQRSYVVEV